MAKYSQVRQHSLREIINGLGEYVQQEADSYVHYNLNPIQENPFPYPFRGNNTGLMMILEGRLKLQINFETFDVGPDNLILFSPKSVIHILEVIIPVRTIGMVFTDEYALKHISTFKDINVLRFLSSTEMPVLSLSQHKRSTVFSLLETIYVLNSQNDEENYYRKEKTFHYFNLLGLEVTEEYRAQIEKVGMKTSKKRETVHEFLNFLSVHVDRERTVQFYADKLFITPGHLSKLLKEVSGYTAREVIEEGVVLEARNLLMDTSLSLAQIAYKLNFSDQSFFGKFFKKKMKITPKTFRDKFK